MEDDENTNASRKYTENEIIERDISVEIEDMKGNEEYIENEEQYEPRNDKYPDG